MNNLIEEQLSIVFEKQFNIKFFKSFNSSSINELDKIDLIIINFIFIKDNNNIFNYLENKKKSKVIIMFDNGVDRSQLKKYNDFN